MADSQEIKTDNVDCKEDCLDIQTDKKKYLLEKNPRLRYRYADLRI